QEVVQGVQGWFFVQAEDGIRADLVTGVQTCALPILWQWRWIGGYRHCIAHTNAIALAFLQVKGSWGNLTSRGEGHAIHRPSVAAFLGGVVLREDHLDGLRAPFLGIAELWAPLSEIVYSPSRKRHSVVACDPDVLQSGENGYNWISPRRVAVATASVRLTTSSLLKILLMWVFTVPSLMNNSAPISLLLLPTAMRCSTSISRGLNASPLTRSASFAASWGGR